MSRIRIALFFFLASINLSVGGQLSIAPSGKERSVYVGSNFVASCTGNGKVVQRVMWQGPNNQQIIEYKARVHVEGGQTGHSSVDLVFEDIQREDRGTYTCSANVDGEEVSEGFELIVLKKIDFSKTESVQYMAEGETSTLMCDPDSDPPADISWRFRDSRILNGSKYSIEGIELVINDIALEDAGIYKCTARQVTDYLSDFKSVDISVRVHHKPQWRNDADKGHAYGYIQGEVNLTCEAEAEPAATFTWIKDGEIKKTSDGVHIYSEQRKSVLQLTVHNEDIFGDYECQAENKLGKLRRVIILEKGTAPPIPSLKKSFADSNAIHFILNEENEDSLMPVLGYKVQYKQAGESWDHEIIFNKGDSYIVNDLDPDIVYVFRVAARNMAGLSEYSAPIAYSTEKAPTAGEIISSGAPNNLNSDQIILFFNAITTLLPIAIVQFTL